MSDQSQLPTVVERMERSPLVAGARPEALVPTNFEGVFRLAGVLAASGMAPRDMNTPEKITVAIMHGLEVGMTPMAALQSIAVVNGRPTIWGDGAIGLIRASGLMDHFKETITGEGDKMTARCEARRKGDKEYTLGVFSVEDAKKAGLWNKSGPWQQYPKRMLQMRARAFALRDAFADVLRGLAIREEMEDVVEGKSNQTLQVPDKPTVPAQPSPAPKQEPVVEDATFTETPAVTAPTAGTAPEPASMPPEAGSGDSFNPDECLKDLEKQCSEATTIEHVAEIRALFEEDMTMLTRSERERAEYLLEEAEKRVTPAEGDIAGDTIDDDSLEPPTGATAPQDPVVDPFIIPTFKDKHAYRDWVLVMCQSVIDLEHAQKLMENWGATKKARADLDVPVSTVKDELLPLVKSKLAPFGLPKQQSNG